ncbi:divergent polysaccharide deacetylase family protein [Albidovulum sediminicola]|uniref:Divergent polysaccharide deacetylase family protein n=1 Tax=Albidovulum sediminicola TaxID=2984331 RepID=A0ABT2Z0L0_9RHOB|nr:polysaccharide deacteylase family 2 protein [Defluviimonas sp. WL0075]MCV2864679.1 divergent polysaccharide deacetylase family protein [Defluviimonas sp. WL0075]
MGTILGGATAAILSLQAAPPGQQLEAVRAAGEAARGAAPAPAPAAMPEPEAKAEVQPEVEPAPSEAAGEEPQSIPDTPIVEVPAGSEFEKAKPEEAAEVPTPDEAAPVQEAPAVSQPAGEGAPQLAEVNTAGQPESQTEAPAAPEAPELTEEATASAAPEQAESAPVEAGSIEPAEQPVAADAGNAMPQIPQSVDAAVDAATDPAVDPAPAEPAPTEEAAAEPASAEEAPASEPEPSTEPEASAEAAVTAMPGQRAGTLPTISDVAPELAAPPADTEPASDDAALEDEGLPALMRYAAPFDLTGVGPTVSIVLLDPGEGRDGVDAAEIEALPFPATIGFDPNSSESRDRARKFRAAGFELVAVVGNGLQRGMTAKDVEVAVEALLTPLPETVAVVPAPDALFQIDREVVKHLAFALKDDGRGLITYARGLNVAGQAAGQAGVPHASVDRVVDEYKEDADSVRRLLDRAAFDAGQKGQAVIVAHAYPETMQALREWFASGPKGVTLAPVSARMIAEMSGQ